jgi:glycogen operon protein
VRNFIATLFLSQGVPMLLAGDEMGRTQQGNNNAYCQDNEISWVNWDLGDDERALLEFTTRASRLMQEHPVLRRRTFLRGEPMSTTGEKDIAWLAPGGQEMAGAEWTGDHVRCLGARFGGGDIGEVDAQGRPVIGEPLVYLMNADPADVTFVLPPGRDVATWECLLDTADDSRSGATFAEGARYPLAGRSVAVFRGVAPPGGDAA